MSAAGHRVGMPPTVLLPGVRELRQPGRAGLLAADGPGSRPARDAGHPARRARGRGPAGPVAAGPRGPGGAAGRWTAMTGTSGGIRLGVCLAAYGGAGRGAAL